MASEENEKVLFRLLYIMKRLTDEWGDRQLQDIYSGFKMSYMPVFMSLTPDGISNNEIAKRLHVSKMASSKILKELTKMGLIFSIKDTSDGRSERIIRTEAGEELYQKVKQVSGNLVKTYESILGEKEYKVLIDSLVKLQRYHETGLKSRV